MFLERAMKKQQEGVMLLEALIAIVIFSLGVLGVVGMQASAVSTVQDAKYRTDAGLLANELLGMMWAQQSQQEIGGKSPGQRLREAFEGDGSGGVTDGAQYTAWLARVASTLPGVAAAPPLVVVGRTSVCDFTNTADSQLGLAALNNQAATSTRVCVVIRWQTPKETSPRNYRVVVDII
ncbi:MAG: type IV pilus modification protein PilV [Rhodocyclaceae bacterium]|nr:MAG: type IV pilus modification protein PilV [Rhodocyclaceae bacterium]